VTNLVDAHLDAIKADLDRRKEGKSLVEEGLALSKSLRLYVRQSWHVIQPDVEFKDNWHIGAMCEQLEEISAGRLRRLLIWVPPGSMKTITVSVCWPTWEWTRDPTLRYLSASYDMDLVIEQAMIPSRDLILSDWYQSRWGHIFALKADLNLKRSYANSRGGRRFASAPNAKKATGRHAHRIVIDDPSDANSAEATSEAELSKVITWHDGTLPTRFADPKTGVKVIVQQRLHERDLSGHVLESDGPEKWRVLCLPEVFEPTHPFMWPEDPRSEGELLWPDRVDLDAHRERQQTLGGHRAAGQLQQRPSAREGEILKRAYWRYYARELLEAAEEGDVSLFPRFRLIICSWDTSFKDKSSSDPVAGGLWGIHLGDRYLLRTIHERAALSRTKTLMLELRQWGLDRWPNAAHRVLIEKKSNGVEIIEQLRKQIPGVTTYNPGNLDKTQRAEAAEPDLESGNVFICGAAMPTLDDYDPAFTPAWSQEVIDQAAAFPNAKQDDLVDMVTQLLNWVRIRGQMRAKVYSPADMRLPATAGIPAGGRSTVRV
jgi:predicted phage terminase large subunit-like protein